MGSVIALVSLGDGEMRLNLNRGLKKTTLSIIIAASLSFGFYLLYLLSTQITTTNDVFNDLPILLGLRL